MLRRALMTALACLAVVSVAPYAQSRRFITEKDLLKFTWVADPQISPDGSNVAFVKVTVNEKENRYESALYLVSAKGGELRRLTSGVRDTGPRWSPDGKRIAFVRVAAAPGDNGAGLRSRHGRRRSACDHRRRARRRQSGLVAGRTNDRLLGIHGKGRSQGERPRQRRQGHDESRVSIQRQPGMGRYGSSRSP